MSINADIGQVKRDWEFELGKEFDDKHIDGKLTKVSSTIHTNVRVFSIYLVTLVSKRSQLRK